jgi:putative oxidoreductase
MNIALWIVQGLLACVFLFAAGLKLFAFDMMAARSPGTENLRGLFVCIALCEIAGAVGLILPRLTGILPVLTPWAATGLATIALLAGGFHIMRGEYGELPGAAVLFLLSTFVVWGRGLR